MGWYYVGSLRIHYGVKEVLREVTETVDEPLRVDVCLIGSIRWRNSLTLHFQAILRDFQLLPSLAHQELLEEADKMRSGEIVSLGLVFS